MPNSACLINTANFFYRIIDISAHNEQNYIFIKLTKLK